MNRLKKRKESIQLFEIVRAPLGAKINIEEWVRDDGKLDYVDVEIMILEKRFAEKST